MSKINKKELKHIFNKMKIDKKQAIEELCNKYYKLIYGIAFSILKNKEDSEDVVQNFITKIYSMNVNNLPKDKEATWLYAVVKNEALEFIRKKNKQINITDENIYEIKNENDEIEEVIDKENFNNLISNLNNKEKEIVSLKIISNLSFSEISKLLEQPISTIKWKYYRAVYKIKLLLGNIAMFIITFTLGVFTVKSSFKKVSNSISTDKNQENVNSSNLNEMAEVNLSNQPLKNEIISEEISGNTTSTDSIVANNINSTMETNYIVQNKKINYIGIGTLCISLIFLIITIYSIFSSKIRPKIKIKTSK